MGFFGILAPRKESEAVEVKSLHANIWMLQHRNRLMAFRDAIPFINAHRIFIDIGVQFVVKKGAIPYFEMALPGGLLPNSTSDLSSFVLDSSTNEFIFGGKVNVRGSSIVYDQEGKHVDHVVKTTSVTESANGTALVIFEHPPVAAAIGDEDKSYYIRFRYECAHPKDLIQGKEWGSNKKGAIFDFRANDIRSTNQEDETSRLLDIEKCYLFLITPSSYVPVFISPALRYSRLLETVRWKKYLSSCKSSDIDGPFTILYWKDTENPTTVEQPLRAFAHLHNEFNYSFLIFYILGIVIPLTVSIYKIFTMPQ